MKNLIIQRQNNENHEIHRIPLQNFENMQIQLFHTRITKQIMKFIEFHNRIKNKMKT